VKVGLSLHESEGRLTGLTMDGIDAAPVTAARMVATPYLNVFILIVAPLTGRRFYFL